MRNPLHFQPLSDEDLISQVGAGQEAAFEELYRRHATRFLRYFYRLLHRDEVRAQDLLQDWCIRIVHHAHRFDSRQRFLPWAYTIAGNLIKNEYRSRSVRQIVTVTDDPTKWGEPSEEWKEGLDREAFRTALAQAVSDLSFTHREAFLLRYQEDLSIKDIASIVDCSEGTVKSRLFYALKKLSVALAAFHPCPEILTPEARSTQI